MPALTAQDFKRLQWNLVFLLLLLGIGGGVVALTVQKEKSARLALAKAQTEHADIIGKLARVQDEESELREKLSKFNTLQSKSIIGEERRLDWVETLRAIKESRRLIDLQYELAPQTPLDPQVAPGTSPGFEFMGSSMKAELLLLHEEDLLRFLSDADAKGRAFTRVRHCLVQKVPGGIASRDHGPSPQLKASCEIDWITVRERR